MLLRSYFFQTDSGHSLGMEIPFVYFSMDCVSGGMIKYKDNYGLKKIYYVILVEQLYSLYINNIGKKIV